MLFEKSAHSKSKDTPHARRQCSNAFIIEVGAAGDCGFGRPHEHDRHIYIHTYTYIQRKTYVIFISFSVPSGCRCTEVFHLAYYRVPFVGSFPFLYGARGFLTVWLYV